MTSDPPPEAGARPGVAFGTVARSYDRGRPDYPREAVEWLVGSGQPRTVLELGAGTGKLTRALVAAGHDVHATDPDERMLEVLSGHLPEVRTTVGTAEEIAVPDRSVDVVVCAQTFHWLDHERALPAIARALRPNGHLAVVWQQRDERIPWVKKLGRLLASPQPHEPLEPLVHSSLFSFVEGTTFASWQGVDRDSLLDLARSRSRVIGLDASARERLLTQVGELYDGYGRGHDGMQLPYVVHCHRTRVVHQTGLFDDGSDAVGVRRPAGDEGEPPESPGRAPDGPSDGTDTDMLLIDFR